MTETNNNKTSNSHSSIVRQLLENAMIIRIAIPDNPYPYLVPICFVYWNDAIYFHSANSGKKIELLRENNHVTFELDENMGIVENKNICKWSIKYRSIVGHGLVFSIESESEKYNALKELSKKYGAQARDFSFKIDKGLEILKIIIEKLTLKINY